MVPDVTGIVRTDDEAERWALAMAELLRGGRLAQMRRSAREYALTRRWEAALQPLYRAYHDACAVSSTATPRDALPVAAGKGVR
jgi:hypothetical protein